MNKNLLSLMFIALPIIILTNNNHNEPSQEELKRRFDAFEYPHKQAIPFHLLPQRLQDFVLKQARITKNKEKIDFLAVSTEENSVPTTDSLWQLSAYLWALSPEKKHYLKIKMVTQEAHLNDRLDEPNDLRPGDVFRVNLLDSVSSTLENFMNSIPNKASSDCIIELNTGKYVTKETYLALNETNKDTIFTGIAKSIIEIHAKKK